MTTTQQMMEKITEPIIDARTGQSSAFLMNDKLAQVLCDLEKKIEELQIVKENDPKWREGALWAIDEAEKCIKPLLQYCKDVNGRDDCKNCGLDEDIFADLRKKIG